MAVETLIRVRCAICAGEAHEIVCPAEEMRAHLRYLRQFHRRRLRPDLDGRVSRDVLVDRADFTQDQVTDVVACRDCGLVFRNPRPPAAAIERAYEADTYGSDRLASLFDAQCQLYRPKARDLLRWLPPQGHLIVRRAGASSPPSPPIMGGTLEADPPVPPLLGG